MIFYTFTDENSRRKEEHSAAHKLLGYGLKKLYGITEIELGYEEHGKPFLINYPDVHFNISHCKGLAVCGFSGKNIGVDAELIREFRPNVMKRVFSSYEQEEILSSQKQNEDFFRIWTLKEALGKYFGTGIFSDLSGYTFLLKNEYPVCEDMNDVIFTQKILKNKWVISVCAHDPENGFVFVDDQ